MINFLFACLDIALSFDFITEAICVCAVCGAVWRCVWYLVGVKL